MLNIDQKPESRQRDFVRSIAEYDLRESGLKLSRVVSSWFGLGGIDYPKSDLVETLLGEWSSIFKGLENEGLSGRFNFPFYYQGHRRIRVETADIAIIFSSSVEEIKGALEIRYTDYCHFFSEQGFSHIDQTQPDSNQLFGIRIFDSVQGGRTSFKTLDINGLVYPNKYLVDGVIGTGSSFREGVIGRAEHIRPDGSQVTRVERTAGFFTRILARTDRRNRSS